MYNTNAVTLNKAIKVAMTYMRAGIIPLLVSPPGIGKTSMVQMIAREFKAELRHLRLNSIPPEEAVGLQFLDHETKRTIRYAPAWLPAEDGSDGDVVVFLDELMQAPDEYRKGIMSALLERYLGQHKIPDNCMFIAAGNSVEDGSNVYELDRATADRFGVIRIIPNLESWANDYAREKNLNTAIVGYLRHRPEHFELTDPDATDNPDIVIKPSPRSWEALSRFIDAAYKDNLEEDEIKAGINGKVGEIIGASVWTLIGTLRKLPTLEQFIAMDRESRQKATPDTMDIMWAYGQAMIWYASDAAKTLKIMQVFDSFDRNAKIPLVECRTNVIETILKRARTVHDFSVMDEPGIRNLLVEWDHEKKAIATGLRADNDGSPETCTQLQKAA